MRQAVAVCSVVLLVLAVSLCHSKRPPYIQCQSSEECGKEECCVIGMGRYSIPSCKPRRDVGDRCRPYSEPANTTLHYPDGESVELRGVYYQLCPCLGGLACAEGESEDPQCTHAPSSNHLYDYEGDSFEDLRT